MEFKSVKALFFSPTGTTKKVVAEMGRELAGTQAEFYDLTYPQSSLPDELSAGDLLIVGVPVYAGRVPALAVQRLNDIQGNEAYCVVITVYGNREYEDALIELRNIMKNRGFQVVAGCVFIGEHSFSTDELPIAAGRPDESDLRTACDYARQIKNAVNAGDSKSGSELNIPGNEPYQEGMKNLPFTPEVDADKCTVCEACVSMCPSGAISLDDKIVMDAELCILCCACAKNCPETAIALLAPPMREKAAWLHDNCQTRKEPCLFLT